jgi:hypothetical protein
MKKADPFWESAFYIEVDFYPSLDPIITETHPS